MKMRFLITIFILSVAVTMGFAFSPVDISVEKVDSSMFPNVDVVVNVTDFKPSKEIDFEILEDGQLIPFLNVKLLSRNRVKKAEIVILMNMSSGMKDYLPGLKNSLLYLSKFLKNQNVDSIYHLFICDGGCKRYDYTDGEIRIPDYEEYSSSYKKSTTTSQKSRVIDIKNSDYSNIGTIPRKTSVKKDPYGKDKKVTVRNTRTVHESLDTISMLERVIQEVDFDKSRQKFIVLVDPDDNPSFKVSSSRIRNLIDILRLGRIRMVAFVKNVDAYKDMALESGGGVFNLDKTMDLTEIYDYIGYIYSEKFELSYKSKYKDVESLRNHVIKIRWNSSEGWKEKEVNLMEPLKIAVGVDDVIEVTGMGAPRPDLKDPYRRFLSARDSAISNARELLLETVKGVQISSDKTIGEMMVEDYIIDKNVRGFLLGAKITYENWNKEQEIYTVKMALKLTGPKGLIKSVEMLKKLENNVVDLSKDLPIRLRYIDKYGFTDSLIYADGFGLAKPSKFTSVSLINARRAAIAEAQKELLAVIKGIAVTGHTFVSDHMITDVKIRTYLNDILRGAEIVEEKVIAKPTEKDYGLYRVKMAVRWDGGIGLYNKLSEYLSDVEPDELYLGSTNLRIEGSKKIYTGLIIDATGLGIKPAIFPKIVDEKGRVIYTYDIVEDDVRNKYSIVEYKRSLMDAIWSDRAGDNPLIVGVKAVKNNGSIIVLDESAISEILKSIVSYNYLKDGKVVVVTGRP